ncbi:MAG: transposase [Pseudomonadota bacterium]|nr:transposase [Pseudomonadota bacterium]MDP1906004.1 transposase [Pseudomonadota bacterium]MDP2352475.1 transposase [Pseudomonadota bacterium]
MNDALHPHGGNLRKGRVSEQGCVYLVTFVVRERRPIFQDFAMGRLLVSELKSADAVGLSKTWAFVVMPDHCHWLLSLQSRSLSSLIGRVKARCAKAIGRGPIWQPGFHDHAARQEEDLQAMARYIVANPLRAGLATRVADYPLWDAAWL